MKSDPMKHYRRNEAEYQTIREELASVRSHFEKGDRETRRAMLYDSTVFAVMSVQNSIETLRRAFRAYATAESWDEVREATRGLNYKNNKFTYMARNEATVSSGDADVVLECLARGGDADVWTAVEHIQELFDGVSWVKAAFVPAMLGFTEVMCIDTNVAQMVPGDEVVSVGYSDAQGYRGAVTRVTEEYPELAEELDPFMVQWVLFDCNRGDGVARHEEWFEAVLPATVFGRQTALGDY